ncbi:MAG: sn-glycerol-3-phosphate ABC transporter ATP-binding protein UgpC [Bacteroidota bacterium]
MSKVELKNIEMSYGAVKVLHNINIEMKDGEFVVLVGPSGCGKSTTLRIIAGLETPQSGDIFIGNKCVTGIPPKERDIAMVFQNYALYPHMNVFENMSFGLKLRKLPKKEIEARVNEAAEILDIKDYLKRKPKELSGGQRQRVALGRAIVRKPVVFLFDEPLSNLDAKLRVQMRTEIKKLHNALKTTMVYVTHDQVEAMTMGDRIVVLKDGYIMQSDKALQLYNKPANQFVAGFIGSPAMNFFKVKVSGENGINLSCDDFTIKLPKDELLKGFIGKEIIIGIRPENLHLCGASHNTIKGRVEVVELMGNESNIYASTLSNNFVAKVPANSDAKVNDTVFFEPDFDKLHFFEIEKGSRIN